MTRHPTRRDLLAQGAAALLALSVTGCDDEAADPVAADGAAPLDTGRAPDAAADAGPSPDLGAADATVDATADAEADAGPPAWQGMSKGPWVHVRSDGGRELRFETRDAGEWAVILTGPEGEGQPLTPLRRTEAIDWRWAVESWPTVDRAGDYTLHRADLGALTPGRWTWTVTAPEGQAAEPVTGSLRVTGPADTVRVAWVADTMWPMSEPVAQAVADSAPDLVLHGGDIQYRSNPGDTWNGFFGFFAGALRQAPLRACVGNHEFETDGEFSQMYLRLLADAPPAEGVGPALDYTALTVGPARVLLLNSESGLPNDVAQLEWLDAELARAAADPEVLRLIVAFHRPTYTFSLHDGAFALREVLHPRFVAAGVDLVLNGHVHAYERFDVDGVQYVVDGGGGSVLYDPDEELAVVQAERPEEVALRQVSSDTHGFTQLEIAPDGGLTLTRITLDAEPVDTLVLPPR